MTTDYILIPIFIVIAGIVTKYSVPVVLYIFKVPHKLVAVVNLLLHLDIFVGIFLALYIWPQPRIVVNETLSWGEAKYERFLALIPEEGVFPASEPTRTPTKSTTTPTKTPSSTNVATPTTDKSNDSSTSSAALQGVVATDFGRLNLRSGPGTGYPSLGMLETGNEVVIIQRTATNDWLRVEAKDQGDGWVSRQYIEVKGDLDQVPITSDVELTPTPTQQTSDQAIATPETFDAYNGRASGTVDALSDKWYTVVGKEQSGATLLVLMFTPNVNVNSLRQAQFFIYEEKQSPNWPPDWPDAIPNLGAGSPPPSDIDGDSGQRELLWKGDLIRGARYYLRIVNGSPDPLKYCLVTEEVKEWICPR